MLSHRARSQKGNAVLEFGIVVVVLVPVLFATIGFGVNLGNMLQVSQITRDVAHIYARGIDFSEVQNQNVAVNLVQGLGGMTVNGGNGVLILSQIRKVYPANCTAAGLGTCPNDGQRVFANRVVIGNTSLRASNFGTPNSTYVSTNGNISSADYLQRSDLRASGFDNAIMPQADGDVAFVVEGFFSTPNMGFLSSWGGANATAGTYTRAIF